MSVKKKDINQLNSLIFVLGTKYKAEVKDVVKLFQERKIHTKRDAIKTIATLGSSGKKSNIKALERIETHRENVLSTDHPSVRYNQKRGTKQNYLIKGSVEATSKYSRTRTGAVTHYDKVYDDVLPFSRTINAVSKKAAIE